MATVITSYATLKTAVADWIGRTDISDNRLSDCIALFELHASRVLRVRAQETSDELTAATADPLVPFNTQLSAIRRVSMTDSPGEPLRFITPDQAALDYGDVTSGRPQAFFVQGRSLRLCPTPDATYTLEIVSYGAVRALSDSLTTNWLLQQAPDAYLWGSLAEASDYVDDDRKLQRWAARRNDSLTTIMQADADLAWSSGPLIARVDQAMP